jgi:NAD(P)-dependent dehydrogenase (short-subunit alcohol dehydrogenase family)
MELELKEKIAVVTGGGMGIGQAIALELAKEGAHVSILDINLEAANGTAAQIEKLGRRTLVCEADVSKASVVDKAIDQTLRDFGRIDILINNAGITHPSVSILDLDLEFLEKVTNLDLNGVYFCSRRVGKEMVRQGSGAIVNIASIAGLTSMPLPVYGPIKSAVIMLTQILARDWAQKGVRVNAIAPGYVLTPLQQWLLDKGLRNRDHLLNYIPMRKFIMPSDIAFAAVFLCSDKAQFITGVTLPVDAGVLSTGAWKAYGYD